MMPRPSLLALASLTALGLLVGTPLAAQVPSTDIWLIPLRGDGSASVKLGSPIKAVDRDGYDNQPSFSADGTSVYFTSIDASGQADIRRYDLASKAITTVITTEKTSEYSPTSIDGGKALSVVRVEEDGSQHLWRFPLDGGTPTSLMPDVAPVGYHAWIDDARLVLFVLGEPHTLQLAVLPGDANEGEEKPKTEITVLAADIGRALATIPAASGGGMSFVHKAGQDTWWVKGWNPETGELRRLIATRPGREDVAWSPAGDLWTGDGSTLYRWRPGDETWTKMADLASAGLRDLTRIAVHPEGTHLAVVAARPAADTP